MIKYLLPISVTYLILTIVGVILIVREIKKSDNKEDMTLIIISFLVPLIGLIIYAVNVGKDKHIVDCALKGLKMWLKFLIAQFIISIIIVLLVAFVFNANITNKKSNKINANTSISESNIQEIEKKIKSNSYVNNVEIEESGKSIYISITFSDNTTESKAKKITESTLDYFNSSYIKKYDFNFSVKSNDMVLDIMGFKLNTSNDVVWYE